MAIMIALIILGLIFKIYNFQFPILNVEMGRGVTNFLLGGIIALVYKKFNNIKDKKIIILSVIELEIIAISILFIINYDYTYYVIILAVFPALLLLSVLIDKYVPKFNMLLMLGKMLFSIYLCHYCYMCFIKILPFEFDYYSMSFFVVYLITLIGISYSSYLLIRTKAI